MSGGQNVPAAHQNHRNTDAGACATLAAGLSAYGCNGRQKFQRNLRFLRRVLWFGLDIHVQYPEKRLLRGKLVRV